MFKSNYLPLFGFGERFDVHRGGMAPTASHAASVIKILSTVFFHFASPKIYQSSFGNLVDGHHFSIVYNGLDTPIFPIRWENYTLIYHVSLFPHSWPTTAFSNVMQHFLALRSLVRTNWPCSQKCSLDVSRKTFNSTRFHFKVNSLVTIRGFQCFMQIYANICLPVSPMSFTPHKTAPKYCNNFQQSEWVARPSGCH